MYDHIIVLLTIVTFIQVGYYGFLFRKFSIAKYREKDEFLKPLSLIIACKNEAENLKKNLPIWLLQDYPSFQIILVNDASTDDTLDIMHQYASLNSNIIVVDIPVTEYYTGNKKNALTLAIEKTRTEYLIFTDADCVPTSNQWISLVANEFSNKKSLVLGYGKYQTKPNILNKLIRFETFLSAWQYFSYALAGIPYMGVGRNIAYTKKLFTAASGFSAHLQTQSGDDDLFVNQVGSGTNTALVWIPQTHTKSIPKNTWRTWFTQKRRHITTAKKYKKIHQTLLSLFYISQLLFFTLVCYTIYALPISYWFVFLIILRYVVYYWSLIPALKKLEESDLMYIAPFLEILLIISQGIIGLSNMISKPKSWN